MDPDLDALLNFAPDYDSPIPYMQRTREYYKAIGYTTPYRWAHYIQAPFTALRKPLGDCNIAIVTTAAPYQPGKGDQGPGAAYNGSAKFYQVYSGDSARTTICAFLISAMTESIRRRPIATVGSLCRLYAAPLPRVALGGSRHGSMARRPTAVTALPLKQMRRRSCAAAAGCG